MVSDLTGMAVVSFLLDEIADRRSRLSGTGECRCCVSDAFRQIAASSEQTNNLFPPRFTLPARRPVVKAKKRKRMVKALAKSPIH
jgi:hypothetical protein